MRLAEADYVLPVGWETVAADCEVEVVTAARFEGHHRGGLPSRAECSSASSHKIARSVAKRR